MAKRRKLTTDAVQILRRRFEDSRSDRETDLKDGRCNREEEPEEARADAEVARELYWLRITAGLTQRQLADLVGTTASVISRLEDEGYRGHSLSMLRSIAAAVGRRVQIRFVP